MAAFNFQPLVKKKAMERASGLLVVISVSKFSNFEEN